MRIFFGDAAPAESALIAATLAAAPSTRTAARMRCLLLLLFISNLRLGGRGCGAERHALARKASSVPHSRKGVKAKQQTLDTFEEVMKSSRVDRPPKGARSAWQH